ncbi:MAG TPA: hypothetical protein VIL07_12130 [Symbiobacteriaceae bacterium]
MYRYLIILAALALLTGATWRGAQQTGMGILTMFGTLGTGLLGVVATMAVTRWQMDAGRREVEAALLSLAPEYLITDWGDRGKDWPDYLVVGPRGLIVICLDETAQFVRARRAGVALARSRERARQAARRLRERLAAAEAEGASVPVDAVVVLTRRRAEGAEADPDVAVLNPEDLAAYIHSVPYPERLDRSMQVRLTRLLRAG